MYIVGLHEKLTVFIEELDPDWFDVPLLRFMPWQHVDELEAVRRRRVLLLLGRL